MSESKKKRLPHPPGYEKEQLLEQISNRVRTAYIRCRRASVEQRTRRRSKYGGSGSLHWDPAEGSTRKSVWLQIANTLLAGGCLDPEGFVAAQFDGMTPTPPMMLQPSASVIYEKWRDCGELEARGLLVSETLQFTRHVADAQRWYPTDTSSREIWEYVLYDFENRLTPLFRYCIAVSEDMVGVAEYFVDAALTQYLTKPQIYESSWGERIPAKMRHHVRGLIEQGGWL